MSAPVRHASKPEVAVLILPNRGEGPVVRNQQVDLLTAIEATLR
jgi:hypothetical protein